MGIRDGDRIVSETVRKSGTISLAERSEKKQLGTFGKLKWLKKPEM
jgi:hypothetical protein